MIIAGQPVLATIRCVDLRVVPQQVVRGGLPTAARRANQALAICGAFGITGAFGICG